MQVHYFNPTAAKHKDRVTSALLQKMRLTEVKKKDSSAGVSGLVKRGQMRSPARCSDH